MKKLITTMTVALVAASVAHADVLAAWDMSGNAGTSGTQAATTTGTGMGAGSLGLGAGLPGGGVGWPDAVTTYADWQISTSLEYALGAGNDYFSFTVTPDAGKTASYDSIFTRFVVNAGATGTDINFALFSDQTGFTTNDVLDSVNIVNNLGDQGSNDYVPLGYDTTFDLSASGLTGISTATEFRIYTWKNSGGNRIGIGHTWGTGSGDDVIVNGTVIPEPATLGLLGFAAAGLLWFRKRFSM